MVTELINPNPSASKLTLLHLYLDVCKMQIYSHGEFFADINLHFKLLRLMFNETPAPAPHQIIQLRSRTALFLPHSPATFRAVDWQLISILPPG